MGYYVVRTCISRFNAYCLCYCPLPPAYCLLSLAQCILLTACYILPMAYGLLPSVCWEGTRKGQVDGCVWIAYGNNLRCIDTGNNLRANSSRASIHRINVVVSGNNKSIRETMCPKPDSQNQCGETIIPRKNDNIPRKKTIIPKTVLGRIDSKTIIPETILGRIDGKQ